MGGIYIFKKKLKDILKVLLQNPILIIVYWIFCYELSLLCMYGRVNNTIYILLGCILFFISIIIFIIIKNMKNKDYRPRELIKLKSWRYISIIIIISITSIYGMKIYESATNYRGKLSWVIERLKNERSVEFEHNNIYKYGVEGIFQDINKKYTLPNKLYMSNVFELEFNSHGTITSLYTFVYGKNNDGEDKAYLITYDKSKSQDITLRLNGQANFDYNDDKLIDPLIETVNAIPFDKTTSKFNEDKYGLLYYGKRNWGYNTDGIINISEKGKEYYFGEVNIETIGYTVSIFVPGKEQDIIPDRYNLICDSKWSQSCMEPIIRYEEPSMNNQQDIIDGKGQFHLSGKIAYKLDVTDKALGSTFYSLRKTIDGGVNWQVINKNPFNGAIGSLSGMTFMDEKLGFIVANNPSGDSGDLYRTDNGGISFEKIDYSPYEVKLKNGASIVPFDCPGIPYEKGDIIYMLVGQGTDGDYNGNSKALYQSKDKGKTWEYVEEVKK